MVKKWSGRNRPQPHQYLFITWPKVLLTISFFGKFNFCLWSQNSFRLGKINLFQASRNLKDFVIPKFYPIKECDLCYKVKGHHDKKIECLRNNKKAIVEAMKELRISKQMLK